MFHNLHRSLLRLLYLSNSREFTLRVKLASDLCDAIDFDIIYAFVLIQGWRPLLRGSADTWFLSSINDVLESSILWLLEIAIDIVEITLCGLRPRSRVVGIVITLQDLIFLEIRTFLMAFLS